MKRKINEEKVEAVFQIVNLVIAMIAFSFLVGLSVEVVSGQQRTDLGNGYWTYDIERGVHVWHQISPPTNDLIPATSSAAAATGAGTGITVVTAFGKGATVLYGGELATVSGVEKGVHTIEIAKGAGQVTTVSGLEAESLTGVTKVTTTAEQLKALGVESLYADKTGAVFGVKGGAATEISAAKLTEAGVSLEPLPPAAPNIWQTSVWPILTTLFWAATVGGIAALIASFIFPKGNAAEAAFVAGFAGTWAYQIAVWSGLKAASLGAVTIGLVAGILIFVLLYKEESKEIVTFECRPWEAPTGGANCEKCNSDLYPCSEYRCKALGQACNLLNIGTTEERCVWINPKDVNSPIIQPWKDVLNKDHNYVPNNVIRPPDRGVIINYDKATDGCVKAFTPLTFGIFLNEPAQCKIDYNRTMRYDDMAYYFGGSNIYKYNHTQTLSLPSPDHINQNAPEIKVDGNYNLYVKCKDGNNNTNEDLFVFSFCVEKGPDVTPPQIMGTSISNNMPFQYGLNETPIEVYVNEPAECKWSKLDMDYKDMENVMTCSRNIWEMNNQMLYKCTDTLTGLRDREDNVFYFKCKDQPWLTGDKASDRNTNTESYKFILKGTQPLNIINVKPNETVKGAGTLATVYLELETDNGYNNGDAWCSYSLTQDEKDYIRMYETGTNKHKQRLDLPNGEYTYYFQCVDLGGNADYANTTFKVEIDNQAPIVVRVYKEGEKLKVITDEKSSCAYSNNEERKCNFQIEEGTNMPYSNSTEHVAEWKTNKNYYVKCKDLNGRQPLPIECSIIVKPQS